MIGNYTTTHHYKDLNIIDFIFFEEQDAKKYIADHIDQIYNMDGLMISEEYFVFADGKIQVDRPSIKVYSVKVYVDNETQPINAKEWKTLMLKKGKMKPKKDNKE